MKEPIDKYLSSVKVLCPQVTEEELQYIESGLTISILNVKDIYIDVNIVQNQIGFVYSGLIRGFYINNNGDQISIKFIK
jgi:CRP/FNR family transcriptional regulator